MSKLMNVIEQIITFGQPDFFRNLDAPKDTIRRVAAGDPSLPIKNGVATYKIPATFVVNGKEEKGSEYEEYLVSGNSMCPEGICNGDYLLMKRNEKGIFHEGDFLIIQVDENYNKKYNRKEPRYKFKLRKALLRVLPDMTDEDIIEKLKDSHFEINLKEKQLYMKRKYAKAREAYPESELVFSITYHDGELCYSFHPTDLIIGRAAILVKVREEKTDYKLLA